MSDVLAGECGEVEEDESSIFRSFSHDLVQSNRCPQPSGVLFLTVGRDWMNWWRWRRSSSFCHHQLQTLRTASSNTNTIAKVCGSNVAMVSEWATDTEKSSSSSSSVFRVDSRDLPRRVWPDAENLTWFLCPLAMGQDVSEAQTGPGMDIDWCTRISV